MEQMDHVAQAKSRVISEYASKQNFQKWLAIYPSLANRSLEYVLYQLYRSYDVDSVSDELLDVIGRIVGVDRPILRITDGVVFGYEGNDSYVNYNVAPYIGEGGNVDAPMSNDLYRRLVKAKIARNISDGSYDSIIELTSYVLGFKVTALVDYGDMTFRLGFAREPDANTKFLIENFEIIPRPQGTRILDYFILPENIAEIERTSSRIYQYSNYTLPGDVAE